MDTPPNTRRRLASASENLMTQDDDPSRERLQGRYANYFQIGHNAFEFVFDFGQAYEADDTQDNEQIDIHTRLITSPASARVLFEMLRESLERYRRAFGGPGGDPALDPDQGDR